MVDECARALRKTLTRHEVRPWLYASAPCAREASTEGAKSRSRATSSMSSVRAKLAIEVDGEHHGIEHQQAHDVVRDAGLTRAGLRVLRFWNHEVDTDLEGVVETIVEAAEGGLATDRCLDRRYPPGRP